MGTTIKVSDWTWEQLKNKKKRGQSFDDVLKEMISPLDKEYNDWRSEVKDSDVI